ncbi:hypothetical protein XF_2676 [Xylella fastidiosa 9a5c]|uniref:Uncharacterized protein n=1 Tax=Xylella fastidiosa (strain 9a5c) TaxID=160492 RepID=Q9PA44_XYLFA|nr:hypothetical protein XF_2676 [Xylella fastidiosa 9a5c]
MTAMTVGRWEIAFKVGQLHVEYFYQVSGYL